ncbi:MAG TPA: ABC transporter ATP-binding protein [Streptosporangiaceae bacterium]|jgi:branched-chain amino acid transport system ATP-binding protein|nr:ABC transporter ATP-binding protein [Streptosporangiaceae bacterium]
MTSPAPSPATPSAPASPAGLELAAVTASYGASLALRDVSMQVPKSSVVALLGANGAGKTTTMKVASGLLRARSGTVLINGVDINDVPSYKRARRGLCLIPEGRGIFRSLTVRENLDLQIPPWAAGHDISVAIDNFPILGKRLGQVAGSLSGGQQQMLALCRAFLSQASVVLVDELSLGLAPVVVDVIFESLAALRNKGVALLIVEQYVSRALAMADHVYLLNRGGITWSGPAAELDEQTLGASYLGQADEVF